VRILRRCIYTAKTLTASIRVKSPKLLTSPVPLGDVKGDFRIDKLTYANSKLRFSVSPVNQSSRGGLITFEGVTPDIFDFEIGSRKPIDLLNSWAMGI
jgi:hypothetical protein